MGELFLVVLYQPIVNLLAFFYSLAPWGGVGLAIILVTIVVKILTLPLTYRSLRAQKEMQEIQPKIEEIKEKYKDDKEALAKELMGVYKTHNVNPFAACLPTILQLFIFIALYRALASGLTAIDPALLYSFIPYPENMGHMFLGFDLTKPTIILAALSAIAQFFQARQMIQSRPPKIAREGAASLDEDMMASMNKMTVTVLPVMMFVIGATTLPAGLTLYIFLSTILTWGMYAYFLRPKVAPKEVS